MAKTYNEDIYIYIYIFIHYFVFVYAVMRGYRNIKRFYDNKSSKVGKHFDDDYYYYIVLYTSETVGG